MSQRPPIEDWVVWLYRTQPNTTPFAFTLKYFNCDLPIKILTYGYVWTYLSIDTPETQLKMIL